MKKPSISKLVNFFIALAQSTGGEVDHSRPTTEEMSRLARKTGAEGIVYIINKRGKGLVLCRYLFKLGLTYMIGLTK